MKAIVIPYNGKPYTEKYSDDTKVMEYNELKYLLSHLPHPFSWFEIVYVKVGSYVCQMYVDEVGKVGDVEAWLQCTNPIATKLYDNDFDCIIGDVVLLSDHHDSDSYLFTDKEASEILSILGS